MRKLVLASVSALALGLAGAAVAQTGTSDTMRPGTGSTAQSPTALPGAATTGTPMQSTDDTVRVPAAGATGSTMGTSPTTGTTMTDRPATSPGTLGTANPTTTTAVTTPGAGVGAMAGSYRASDLIGKDLVGPDGNEIAEISDLIIDSNHMVRQAIVDVGGFLGIGSKPVAIEMSQIQHGVGDKGKLMTTLTKEQLKELPAWDRNEGRGTRG